MAQESLTSKHPPHGSVHPLKVIIGARGVTSCVLLAVTRVPLNVGPVGLPLLSRSNTPI